MKEFIFGPPPKEAFPQNPVSAKVNRASRVLGAFVGLEAVGLGIVAVAPEHLDVVGWMVAAAGPFAALYQLLTSGHDTIGDVGAKMSPEVRKKQGR